MTDTPISTLSSSSSSSFSSSNSNFSSISVSSTSITLEDDEESLIEALKNSLKITINNEYLESEIEDLKEFFTVKLTTVDPDNLDDNLTTVSPNEFWLQVYLPVTVKCKETFKNETPLISFKIKSKEAEEDRCGRSDRIKSDNDNNCNESESREQVISASTVSPYSPLPYEIKTFKVTELSETSEDLKTVLSEILRDLIDIPDISILTVIEDFYIKLEERNYPSKEVICRDYYYPVFDCRHWGRSTLIKTMTASNGNGKVTKTQTITSQILCGSNESTSDLLPVSYRARALYDFQALMQGELSFKENEILLVLANLGNGWLTARRVVETGSTEEETGLIPENYIERI